MWNYLCPIIEIIGLFIVFINITDLNKPWTTSENTNNLI